MKNIVTKIIAWGLIGVFAVSVVFNIAVIKRFGLVDVFHFKLSRLIKPSTSEVYYEEDNGAFVHHLLGKNIQKLNKIESDDLSHDIPDQLIISPGTYNFADSKYSLKKEGLYRLIIPDRMNAQRIVYHGDIDALLSAVSWIVTHGDKDNGNTYIDPSEKAMHSKMFMTCLHVSAWARSLLTELNVKSRLVAGVTVDDWNSFDNGHSLIEVWRDKWNKWVLYDLDNNSYFLPHQGTVPLSLVEFSQVVAISNYKIVSLSSDIRLDVSDFSSSNGFSYSFILEEINTNIREWYRRVMQVPLIFDERSGKYLFMDQHNKDRVQSYLPIYKYIDKTEFMGRFYE